MCSKTQSLEFLFCLPILFLGVKERPDAQCESLLRYTLQEGTWLPQDRLQACEAIDTAYFHHRVANTLQFDRVVAYVHGDCSLRTAIESHRRVKANANAANVKRHLGKDLVLGESQTVGAVREAGERSRLLARGTHTVVALPAFNKEDPNCALVTFMQVTTVFVVATFFELILMIYYQKHDLF